MFTRRTFVGAAATLAVVGSAQAQDACMVVSKAAQAATTPEAAIAALKAGNERFVAGKSVNCDLMAQVKITADGQYPIAAVVGCIDSRVPPELVFDQKLGAMFTARVAGNFVNTDILGSLEFACKITGAKAIVVLGHTDCGAIKGALDQAKLGNRHGDAEELRSGRESLQGRGRALLQEQEAGSGRRRQ